MVENEVSLISTISQINDIATYNHCRRVASMVKKFCQIEHFPEWQIRIIYEIALIHDVGKLMVPKEVLNSTAPLDSNMRKQINLHSEYGAQIVNTLLHCDAYVSGVLSHHERWDGTGYPLHLQKEEIPYEARVIAVFDSIDAMCGFRYYRKPISIESCKKEIVKCSGAQFDPDIVRKVMDSWSNVVSDHYINDTSASA